MGSESELMGQTEWRSGPQWPTVGPGCLGWGEDGGDRSLVTFTPRSTSLCWTRMTTALSLTSPLTRLSACQRTAPWASVWPLSRHRTLMLAAMGRWASSEIAWVSSLTRGSHRPSKPPHHKQEAETRFLTSHLSS